jgi:hypothetical protein
MKIQSQCTSAILMIRPASFGYNEETATNNSYQQKPVNTDIATIKQQALNEFDAFAQKLADAGVNVIVVSDTPEPQKPDALFPNNWISFHEDGTVVLYPMYAKSRRTERKKDILETLEKQHGFIITSILDLTHFENDGKFLEGTGSLVLDRVNQIAYASVSERTAPELVNKLCLQFNYKPILFNAAENGIPVYHTNVVLSVCDRFAIICLDYISSETEKEDLLRTFRLTQKEVLTITARQASSFTGNMLELKTKKGESLLVMSTSAYVSLDAEQLSFLNKYCKIIHSPLDTIEKYGGGSARCMIAEIFLPGNKN